MTEIAGKTAFITGGASGIGFAIANALAKRGANIMLADINQAALETAKAHFADMNVGVDTILCDVAKPEDMQRAAQATLDRFGKVHLVVNNAGVGLGGEPGKIKMQDWRWIVDINLMGVVHGVEFFVPHIQSHGEGGHIVNVASMAGHGALAGMAPYHATKFAVVGYSEALKLELMPHKIGVSILCPGWVKTAIHESASRRPSGNVDMDAAENLIMKQVIESGLPPERVAEWTADCVEADRTYIFTHPEMRIGIDMRYALLKEDYSATAAHPDFAVAQDG